jgi:hypothetical protein
MRPSHLRRGWPLVLALVATLIAAPSASAERLPGVTPTGQVQVYNVSLKLVDCTARGYTCPDRWKDYFRRLGDKTYRPDVINILEVPYAKASAVIGELAAGTGTATSAWDYVHSDKDATNCPHTVELLNCGNNMIAFRTARFNQLSVKRFQRFEWEVPTGATNATCDTHLKWSRDIAVTLQEKDSSGNPIADRVVVAAAVHASSKLPASCLETYLSNVDAQIEVLRPARPLTVITGDLNEPPQGSGTLTTEQRQEQCPAPWYAKWSLPQTAACATTFGGQYRDAIRHDTVRELGDICEEWTYDNDDAASAPGTCESPKKRIDYVWVRRELSGGTIAEPTVLDAETDRGYYTNYDWATRYSDHRALEALVQW